MSDEELKNLWKEVYALDKDKFPGNGLHPIFGSGRTHKPKFMFIFINPTARNISSDPGWKGPRFPFIGTKQVWRIFHRSGLFDSDLMAYIEKNPVWSVGFTLEVLDFLKRKGIYLTNIVKVTGRDAALPDSAKIRLFLPTLLREIEIVDPEYIVTFGLIPFESLTKKKIKLGEYYSEAGKKGKPIVYKSDIGSKKVKIIPCYFPIGRGNPKKAVEILKMLGKL